MFYRSRKKLAIYNSIWLDIVISDDFDKLNEEFKETGTEEEWFACVFKSNFTLKEGEKGYQKEVDGCERLRKAVSVVLNPNFPGNKITKGIIMHEAIHIKNKIFAHVGYRCKANNDEHEAYFTEYLFNKINKFYKKALKEEKKLTLKTEENGEETSNTSK